MAIEPRNFLLPPIPQANTPPDYLFPSSYRATLKTPPLGTSTRALVCIFMLILNYNYANQNNPHEILGQELLKPIFLSPETIEK